MSKIYYNSPFISQKNIQTLPANQTLPSSHLSFSSKVAIQQIGQSKVGTLNINAYLQLIETMKNQNDKLIKERCSLFRRNCQLQNQISRLKSSDQTQEKKEKLNKTQNFQNSKSSNIIYSYTPNTKSLSAVGNGNYMDYKNSKIIDNFIMKNQKHADLKSPTISFINTTKQSENYYQLQKANTKRQNKGQNNYQLNMSTHCFKEPQKSQRKIKYGQFLLTDDSVIIIDTKNLTSSSFIKDSIHNNCMNQILSKSKISDFKFSKNSLLQDSNIKLANKQKIYKREVSISPKCIQKNNNQKITKDIKPNTKSRAISQYNMIPKNKNDSSKQIVQSRIKFLDQKINKIRKQNRQLKQQFFQ